MFWTQAKFYLRVLLVFSVLVFSVLKKFKSNYHLFFLAIFRSENYAYQVCKLYFLFRHVQNFEQYLYSSVLKNSESALILPSVKFTPLPFYPILYFTFWWLKTLQFEEKLFNCSPCTCLVILSKKQNNRLQKNFRNTEMIGHRKLSIPC